MAVVFTNLENIYSEIEFLCLLEDTKTEKKKGLGNRKKENIRNELKFYFQ